MVRRYVSNCDLIDHGQQYKYDNIFETGYQDSKLLISVCGYGFESTKREKQHTVEVLGLELFIVMNFA